VTNDPYKIIGISEYKVARLSSQPVFDDAAVDRAVPLYGGAPLSRLPQSMLRLQTASLSEEAATLLANLHYKMG